MIIIRSLSDEHADKIENVQKQNLVSGTKQWMYTLRTNVLRFCSI